MYLFLLLLIAIAKPDPGATSMVVADDLGELPVCRLSVVMVNLTGLAVGNPEKTRALAASVVISQDNVTVPLDPPAQTAGIYQAYGGSWMNFSIDGILGQHTINFGMENVSSTRGSTFLSCDPAFCWLMGWSSAYCTGPTYNPNGTNWCYPLQAAAQAGALKIVQRPAGASVQVTIPSPPTGPHAFVAGCLANTSEYVTCPNYGTLSPTSFEIPNEVCTWGSGPASSILAEVCSHNVEPEFNGIMSALMPFVYTSGSNTYFCGCIDGLNVYAYDEASVGLGPTDLTILEDHLNAYSFTIATVAPATGCQRCRNPRRAGYADRSECAAALCKFVSYSLTFPTCDVVAPLGRFLTERCENGTFHGVLIGVEGEAYALVDGVAYNMTGLPTRPYRGYDAWTDWDAGRNSTTFYLIPNNGDAAGFYNNLYGASAYAYPNSFLREFTWVNTSVTWNQSLNVEGVFDFIGDIASDLFGLATEDDIEGLVVAAESALKASKEALQITKELSAIVIEITDVIQNVVDDLNTKLVDMYFDIAEVKQGLIDLNAYTSANLNSMRSVQIAEMVRSRLNDNAVWDTLFQSLLARYQSEVVSIDDPFIPIIAASVSGRLLANETLGSGGSILSAVPMMKKQIIKTAQNTWAVYGVPVCQGSVRAWSVTGAKGGLSRSGPEDLISEVPELEPFGTCLGAVDAAYPSRSVVGQGTQRYLQNHLIKSQTTSASLADCISSLVSGPVVEVGNLPSAVNSTRSVYRTSSFNNAVWQNSSSGFALIKLGPCQYNLVNHPGLQLEYQRLGLSSVKAKGDDLIILDEGDLVLVVSGIDAPGFPIKLDCRPGDQVASVLDGSQPGWINNMVKTFDMQTMPFPSSILEPELNFRNRTAGQIIDVTDQLNEIRDDANTAIDHANEAIRRVEDAQAQLKRLKNCSLWDTSDCDTLQQIGIALFWIAVAIAACVLLYNLVGHIKPTRMSKNYMALFMFCLVCSPVNAQLEGDDGNTTTTVAVNTTTTTTIETTTSTPPLTTTTTTTETTTTGCGGDPVDNAFYEVRNGVCCLQPRNLCTPVSPGECNKTELAYVAFFWIAMVGMAWHIICLSMYGGRKQASWMNDKATESIVKGLAGIYGKGNGTSYPILCTSNTCKGGNVICYSKLVRVIDVVTHEIQHVVMEGKDVSASACGKCGQILGYPIQLWSGDWKVQAALKPDTGIRVDEKPHLIKNVQEKLDYSATDVTKADADTFKLDTPSVRNRIPGAKAALLVGSLGSMLQSARAQVWRDNCELSDYSGPCCRTEETQSYLLHWILFALIVTAFFFWLLKFAWIIRSLYTRAKRNLMRLIVSGIWSKGMAATTIGILSSVQGADAAPEFNVQWIDDPDCSWSNFSDCSAGHKLAFLIITSISLIFSFGLMMLIWRLLGCLRALTKCLSFKTAKQDMNEKLVMAMETIASSMSGAGKKM